MQFTPVLEASGDPDQIEIECGDVGHKVDKCSRQRVGFEAKQKLVSVDVCKKSCNNNIITTKHFIFSVHGLKRVRLSRDLSWKSATKLPNVALSRVSISAKTKSLATKMVKTYLHSIRWRVVSSTISNGTGKFSQFPKTW